MIPRWLANVIVVLVLLVWVGNFAATVFVHGYTPDPYLSFVFLAIVGGALGLKRDGTGSVMSRVITALHPPTPPPAPPVSTHDDRKEAGPE